MATLVQRLAQYFRHRVRERGAEYFRYGQAHISDSGDDQIDGYVRGSRDYAVELAWEQPCLDVFCDCPAFEREGNCKHIWAMILAADSTGALEAVRRASRVLLRAAGDLAVEADNEEIEAPCTLVPPPGTGWRARLRSWRPVVEAVPASRAWSEKRRLLYVLDVAASERAGAITLQFCVQDCNRDGSWVDRHSYDLSRASLPHLPPADADIVACLCGAGDNYGYPSWQRTQRTFTSRLSLDRQLSALLLPRIVATGRCVLRANPDATEGLGALAWDDAGPWQFQIAMYHLGDNRWQIAGRLCRGSESLAVSAPLLIAPDGFVVTPGAVGVWEPRSGFPALAELRRSGPIVVSDGERDALLAELWAQPAGTTLVLPEELQVHEESPAPVPHLAIRTPTRVWRRAEGLHAEISFAYSDWLVTESSSQRACYQAEARRVLRRDAVAEQAASGLLPPLGFRFRREPGEGGTRWALAQTKLPAAVRALIAKGWNVEADGKLFRHARAQQLSVSSGIDWFELHGEVDYGTATASLPALLQALRRGESMVKLGDGSFGIVPEEWLRQFRSLADMGTVAGDHLRFRSNQACWLDALLAAQPTTSCDAAFEHARAQLRLFEGIRSAEQPAGFAGQLRDYQREGLGWLLFLRRFSLGGCLADDMGVGKTAQALALLEHRRTAAGAGATAPLALIVAPRSLVFNWKQEAARFTPSLRLLDYTGAARQHDFSGYDAVLTTYGTLRREILRLKGTAFDTLILDEAQAIKNASTAVAKAARLLQGEQRLALSGTPVENRLAELWSLFDFLNPGMLGSATAFEAFNDPAAPLAAEARGQLARLLRPMILRRTKEQVARELPVKTEQTIACVMKPAQRRLYEELRHHYRRSLLGQVDRVGLAKSKIQVLEALLRLRQAACHPGLIDRKRCGETSAKLDALLENLREVLAEGHKALVFSQFTSMLGIVRQRLDAEDVCYEYLDGRTRDRKSKVERFQTDPQCRLFLISLKAGGVGLNLTAADYVFLLDPWWNPAVEAQAVDRAHRIGQTRQVFAYRLITAASIEEKVLALQASKRELTASLIGDDNRLLRDLRREDLEALLG